MGAATGATAMGELRVHFPAICELGMLEGVRAELARGVVNLIERSCVHYCWSSQQWICELHMYLQVICLFCKDCTRPPCTQLDI